MADKVSIVEMILAAKDEASAALNRVRNSMEKVKESTLNMGSIFTSFKGIVAGAFAALSIGTFVSYIKDAIDTTVKLGKEVSQLQRMTGESAEAASELIAVADQVGISFDMLSNSIIAITRKMGGLKNIEDLVTDASGKSIDVFEKFNIQIKNQDGTLKSFTDVFGQIRDRIRSTSSETERMTIATQFFRSNAAQLMPLLTMTTEQYKEIANDARKYGLVLTQDTVNSVREFVMAHRDLDDVIQGAKISLGKELIPVLIDVIKWVTQNSAQLRNGQQWLAHTL